MNIRIVQVISMNTFSSVNVKQIEGQICLAVSSSGQLQEINKICVFDPTVNC